MTVHSLGLLSETLVDKKNTPLETLSHYLANRLAYSEGETDILIMRHDIGVLWPDRRQEMIHIDLVQYGDSKKYTAMAATVGFPTAIATKMILEGMFSNCFSNLLLNLCGVLCNLVTVGDARGV